jgi:hypothetical protein
MIVNRHKLNQTNKIRFHSFVSGLVLNHNPYNVKTLKVNFDFIKLNIGTVIEHFILKNKMKKVITILLSTLILFSYSQNNPIQIKKLTKEEIELKVYEPYPDAPAVITYDIGEMYFDTNPNGQNLFLFQKRHVRIKILNEEGLKYAKIKFEFSDMNCENLFGELSYNLKGFTHHITENGEIKSIKVKYKNITVKDTTNCKKVAEVTFPDVQIGSIIECVLIIPTLKLIKPDSWYFGRDIPVIYSEFRAYIPNDFEYLFSLKNIDVLPSEDSTFYNKLLSFRFKAGNYIINSNINLSGKMFRFVNYHVPIAETPLEAQKINIMLKRITAKQSDYAYKKLTRSLMITTWDDYDKRTPGQRRLLPYPPAYVIYYLPTWTELNENLLQSDKFGQALLKFWDCDSIIEKQVQNKNTKAEKAEAIYLFVKENVKWNNQYALYADVSDNLLKTIYGKTGAKVNYNNIGNYFLEGEGNSAEINFILMYLLKKAKFQVSPVLVNTSDNEPVDVDIPLIDQFKSVMALVEIEGKDIILDASEPESSFHEVSKKYDTKQMYVVRKNNFGWIKTEQ